LQIHSSEKNSNISTNISKNQHKNKGIKDIEIGTLNSNNKIEGHTNIEKENENNKNKFSYEEILEKFKAIKDSEISSFGRILGEGAYGVVLEVSLNYSQKKFAGKLVSKTVEKAISAEKILEFRGYNIVKIISAFKLIYQNTNYILFIMEKSYLRDLFKLTEFFFRHNLLKIIFVAFIEITSDYLLRFYGNQIIYSIWNLENYSYVHFDIKPDNLLVNNNLILKLCDFGLLTNIKNKHFIRIPGGTRGYISPEYYSGHELNQEDIKKQDYFGLGAILFYLKFGVPLLEYKQHEKREWNENEIIEQLKVKMAFINSRPTLDNNLIQFLILLINPYVKERLNFEGIYRNKWRNQNQKNINEIMCINENDEEKQIMELEKSDFLTNIVDKPKKRKKIDFKLNIS
jgi:serine/threonine protein kinase